MDPSSVDDLALSTISSYHPSFLLENKPSQRQTPTAASQNTTMPRPIDPPDVRASKTLAYILRHGAEKEGLHIRSDGFIKLKDVVSGLRCCRYSVESVQN
jgi:RNA:NAD 2'-phosphotransferase (TPT1/KptA family)